MFDKLLSMLNELTPLYEDLRMHFEVCSSRPSDGWYRCRISALIRRGKDYQCVEFRFSPAELQPGMLENIFDNAANELKRATGKL